MLARVRQILREHGSETVSFQTLEPGLEYWIDGESFVAYADTGSAWVAAGSPVGPAADRDRAMRAFAEAAQEARRRAVFFAAEGSFTDDFRTLAIGEQPFWSPAAWPDTLARVRSLREQLRRARAKGVVVRELDHRQLAPGKPDRLALDRLAETWKAGRMMAPMSFLVTLDLYGHADERRYFVAETGGTIVGLLVAVPIFARAGWFFEDVIRAPDAPNGSVELLFDHAMRCAGDDGVDSVTFGLAPLAGVETWWIRRIRDHTRWLYDFEGLRRFKNKLRPGAWRPVYLVREKRTSLAHAVLESLRAFAGGSLVGFGVRTLLHQRRAVTWLLAALLVPWTALLAVAPLDPFFPSEGVRTGWIVYDALLFTGLVAQARVDARGLAQLLAAGALLDVSVGTAQLVTDTAARLHGVLDWLAAAIALVAPLTAFVFLTATARLSGNHPDAGRAHHGRFG